MNRFRLNQSGATLVEFAITLPILVALILGGIEFGALMNVKSALGRTASDAAHIAAAGSAGPITADSEVNAIPSIIRQELGELASGTLAIRVDEITALDPTGTSRILVEDGDANACPLPPVPDLAGMGLRHGERVVVVRLCIAWDSPIIGGYIGTHHLHEVRMLPMHRSIPISCAQLLALGETADGIYTIDPDGAGATPPLEVRCDMAHGGWTLIAAQFEADPVAWDEGVTPGYDPTLQSLQSFALSNAEIPPHDDSYFGTNFDLESGVGLDQAYTTGELDLSSVAGLSGGTFALYRYADRHYVSQDGTDPYSLDPDDGILPTNDPDTGELAPPPYADFLDCLVLDVAGSTGRNWWFCPNASTPAMRGNAFAGSDHSSADDGAAWTIWVK